MLSESSLTRPHTQQSTEMTSRAKATAKCEMKMTLNAKFMFMLLSWEFHRSCNSLGFYSRIEKSTITRGAVHRVRINYRHHHQQAIRSSSANTLSKISRISTGFGVRLTRLPREEFAFAMQLAVHSCMHV